MENVSKEMLERSDEMISKMTADEIRALFEENDKLRQELRIRDNDILSHDQVFDSIVRGTYHVILVMSVTTFKAEFITTNIDAALGIDRAEAMEDVRMIGHSFENIEDHNGREEIFIHRTNGTRRQFLVYVIHLPYGRSDRVAVVLLCKSARVRGDFEEMMIQQTEDVNRAAGYFLASMSHDFRVPISTISGFVMLLMKNSQNPSKVLEYSHRIGMACQELLSTLDQILDMSRIESVDAGLESDEFGLGLMLDEICATFSSLAKANSQKFIFSSEGIEHDIVIGDKARIMEVLRGVLSNAVKYTPAGGRVELTVTGTPDEKNEDISLIFEIRDTGIGMDQKQLQDYFRSDNPDNIRLTLKNVNIGTSDFWEEHGIHRMVVVNGNIQEAARIRNLMESAGVDTVTISSGFGAVKMIEQQCAFGNVIDVILLDEDLQDMEWQEVMGSLRMMSWINLPMVFLMSGRQIREEECKALGLSHVLQKPFSNPVGT